MRIYEGSPRQDWEEALRSIGAYADRERLKELLFLELEPGFILQGLSLSDTSGWSESTNLHKRTVELTEEEVGRLIERRESERGTAGDHVPHLGIENYYEQALRVLGRYIDQQKARDVFFFEQEGSFVLRLLSSSAAAGTSHHLAEFTRDEIVAMIEAAPQHRNAAPEPQLRGAETQTGEAAKK
jgi:hypothetical protein